MAKNDTVKEVGERGLRTPWEQDDCVRWVEWRIRELTIREGKYADERGKWLLEAKAAGGRKFTTGDAVAEYGIWLLKVRDGLQWHQIAYRFFPSATEEDIEKYKSRVRRIFERVEKNHPGSALYESPTLSDREETVLEAVIQGVIPVYISDSAQSDVET